MLAVVVIWQTFYCQMTDLRKRVSPIPLLLRLQDTSRKNGDEE